MQNNRASEKSNPKATSTYLSLSLNLNAKLGMLQLNRTTIEEQSFIQYGEFQMQQMRRSGAYQENEQDTTPENIVSTIHIDVAMELHSGLLVPLAKYRDGVRMIVQPQGSSTFSPSCPSCGTNHQRSQKRVACYSSIHSVQPRRLSTRGD